MKKPEEMLKRGTGNFLHCTDYEDAIEAMKEYGKQCLEEACKAQMAKYNEMLTVPLPEEFLDLVPFHHS